MFRNTPLQYAAKNVPAGMYMDINELGELLQELASVSGERSSDNTINRDVIDTVCRYTYKGTGWS